MADCDAIVTGADNDGLTAATTLAGQGSKVSLIEQYNILLSSSNSGFIPVS